MKNKLAAVAFGLITSINTWIVTISADEALSKEEIISEIWEDRWFGTGDDGTEFPEASFNHNLLEDWVNSNYSDNENFDWSDLGRLKYQYSDYYSDMTGEWLFTDEDGKWYITDEENDVVYHFSMFQGEWNMIDDNGNTVDIFKPFSTLEEDEKSVEYVSDRNDSDDNHRVVPGNEEAARQKASEWAADKVVYETVAVTAGAAESEGRVIENSNKKNSGSIPVAAVVLSAAAVIFAGAFVYIKKKG